MKYASAIFKKDSTVADVFRFANIAFPIEIVQVDLTFQYNWPSSAVTAGQFVSVRTSPSTAKYSPSSIAEFSLVSKLITSGGGDALDNIWLDRVKYVPLRS